MAVKVLLQKNGMVKESYVGFSWTFFFFGFWVPIVRGNLIFGAIVAGIQLVIGLITLGVGAFISNIIGACIFNKFYTEDMLKQGYEPIDEINARLLEENRINPKK